MTSPIKRTFNQLDADEMFNFMLNGESIKECYNDCQYIKTIIKDRRNIHLSSSAVFKFWKTRSSWWDASWLGISANEKSDDLIIEYWDKFINEWHIDDETENS